VDWSNERYVRLCIRDTTSWKRLGWDGQCMLMALLRKVDRSGSMDLDGLEPWEGAMLHTGAPEDMARRGVEAMLRIEVIAVRGTRLVFPNFIAAQECTKSDVLRSRESRERRADEKKAAQASQEVTQPSQEVTQPSQEVTQPSQVDQDRPSASRGVTPYCAVPCCAVPSLEEDSSPSAPAVPSEAAGLVLELDQASEADRRKAAKRDPVFDHWVKVMDKVASRTLLTSDRRKKLKAMRAEGYTDEQLCQAIDGCRLSEWHMGKNPNGQAYNDLVTILRDGAAVQAHIERAAKESEPSAPRNVWRISSI